MSKPKSQLREYIEAILLAIVIAFFIRTFVIQAYKIPSGSMKPTLQIGDHILVTKFIYGIKIPFIRKTLVSISDPKRGDIVVFIYPEDRSKDFVKRVIGIGGDTIEIKNKIFEITGKYLHEWRNEKGQKQAIKEIEEIRERYKLGKVIPMVEIDTQEAKLFLKATRDIQTLFKQIDELEKGINYILDTKMYCPRCYEALLNRIGEIKQERNKTYFDTVKYMDERNKGG